MMFLWGYFTGLVRRLRRLHVRVVLAGARRQATFADNAMVDPKLRV